MLVCGNSAKINAIIMCPITINIYIQIIFQKSEKSFFIDVNNDTNIFLPVYINSGIQSISIKVINPGVITFVK